MGNTRASVLVSDSSAKITETLPASNIETVRQVRTDLFISLPFLKRVYRIKTIHLVFSLPGVTDSHSASLKRLVVRVEQPRAEVGGSASVDDGTAYDVWALLKCEAF